MTQTLSVEQPRSGLTYVTLRRPDARNALNLQLLTELSTAVKAISKQPHQRVLILRGDGPVFCAGLDLKEAMDSARAHILAEKVADVLATIYHARLVTIAAIHGAAVAGGAGIAAACDLVVAAEGTQIGFPETRRGLVAALVLSLLHRQLPDRYVRELLLTGELVTAQRAEKMGLVNHVVPADQLQETADRLAYQVLQGAPGATKLSKQLIDELQSRTLDDDLKIALSLHQQVRASEEAEEGIRAFIEKSPPRWISS